MNAISEINMVGNTCNQANWVDELFTKYEKCTVILQTAQLINLSVLKKIDKQTICRKQKCKLYHMSLILTIRLTFIKVARSICRNTRLSISSNGLKSQLNNHRKHMLYKH